VAGDFMFWNSKDRAARLPGILLSVLAGVVALVTILSFAYRRYNSISLYSRDPITPPFSPNFCRYTLPMAEHRQTSRLLSLLLSAVLLMAPSFPKKCASRRSNRSCQNAP